MAQIAGPVRAGGMGIVGACNLVVAGESANFAFTEARIGVAPAMISLTTLDTMGQRQAARYWLTGETFGAAAAARLGLITVACGDAEIDEVTGNLAAQILATSPQGSAETRRLLTAARRQRLAADGADMAALSRGCSPRRGPGRHPRLPGAAQNPPGGPDGEPGTPRTVRLILIISAHLFGRTDQILRYGGRPR